MKIDINKKYCYRNGKPARILCVDGPCIHLGEPQPVMSMEESGDVNAHFPSGRFKSALADSDLDLIEVREPREGFISVVTEATYERAYRLGDPVGTFVTHRPGDEEDGFEVIRVREIID